MPEKILEEFSAVAGNPLEYARELKDRGRRIVGFFCSYTPEEIIVAAGIHPLRLFGAAAGTAH
ncbi:MAG: 2-hydroxyacyl-CoA dehydratase, partial [Deltaproteobacteria bacterium]|nr:2-hydroxyacyl-CoA dehydratase [Deltaproteobacteria bacterium]